MLKDYVLEGGPLMLILAGMFFVVLLLALYAAFVYLLEVGRARRFRARVSTVVGGRLESIRLAASTEDSLPARLTARLLREPPAGATAAERRRLAARCEDALLGELSWPGEVLHFLGAYATKVGLCGTIFGLCLHFIAFGTEASAQVASRAMAVALYTTLGALAVALVAEPVAYALSWGERWVRRDLRAWTRLMEELLGGDGRLEERSSASLSGKRAELREEVSSASVRAAEEGDR